MIIVKAEINLEALADAIDQLAQHDIETLARWLSEDTIGQAVKLNLALDSAIKEVK